MVEAGSRVLSKINTKYLFWLVTRDRINHASHAARTGDGDIFCYFLEQETAESCVKKYIDTFDKVA